MAWLSRAFGGGARTPRDVGSAHRSALLAVLAEDWERAEELLSEAARMEPDGVATYVALGRLYRRRGEIDRAIRVHQNLLLRADLDADTRRVVKGDVAEDLREGGYRERAIAAYEELLADDKNHRAALRALVPLLVESGRFPRALELERRLARLDGEPRGPREAVLLVSMAEAAWAEGRGDEARRALRRALRRDRGCARAWVVLGDLEAERGRAKAARAAWSRVPALAPGLAAQVYPRLGAAYGAAGKTSDFESYLRKRLEEEPRDAAARRALAHLLVARGDVDTGIEELRRLLEDDSGELDALAALLRVLLTEHRDAELRRSLAELLDRLAEQGLVEDRAP